MQNNSDLSNTAEKEASEVLHSLLSVERVTMDNKDTIIVAIPSMTDDSSNELNIPENAQWHTPVLGQNTIFYNTVNTSQDMGGQNFVNNEATLWQDHNVTIQNPSQDGKIEPNGPSEMLYGSDQYNANSDNENDEIELEMDVDDDEEEDDEVDVKPTNNLSAKKTISNDSQFIADSAENINYSKIIAGTNIKIERINKKQEKKKKEKTKSNEECEEVKNRLESNPEEVKTRLKQGCECRDNCYRGLNPDAVYKHRLNIAELAKSEHDMYLMGITMASLANPNETSRNKVRRRLRASYVYQGRRVCLEAFLYLENVTHYQLKRIRQHVMTHGVAPRVHGNIGKKPYNTFSLDIYQHATDFLKKYLEQYHENSSNGEIKKSNKSILIQDDSRKNLFEAYKEYGTIIGPDIKLMGYSSFRQLMKDQFPHVKFGTKKNESSKEAVPFRSGKCMTYDKNKDPIRIQQEKAKAAAKKAAMDLKKSNSEAKKKLQLQQSQHIQPQQHTSVVIHSQQLQPQNIIIQQPQMHMNQGQVNINSQLQTIQQPHQLMQQNNVREEPSQHPQPVEITQQVIPVAVVQHQQQQTFIVTPVSQFQTRVQGTWYRQ